MFAPKIHAHVYSAAFAETPPMPPSTSGRRWVRPSWGAESCATSRA